VYIDTDTVLVEGDRDHEIRGFSADAGQLAQVLNGIGNLSPELLVHHPGQEFQAPGLGAPESDWKNEFLQPFQRDLPEIGRRLYNGEEAFADICGGSVSCPRAQNRGYQNPEGVASLRLNQINDRRMAVPVFAFE
jgi:hypothetical protein